MTAASSLNYEWAGSRQNPVILYLHGFLGAGLDWWGIAGEIPGAFSHLFIDLPGHGQSYDSEAANPEISFIGTAEQIIELLDQLNIAPCRLVGYSMGGRLALYLAWRYPARFSHVVIESAAPGLFSAAERASRQKQDEAVARRLETTPLQDFLEDWYSQALFAQMKSHPDYHKLLASRGGSDRRALAQALRGLSVAGQPSLWENLAEIKIPALLIYGALDDRYRQIMQAMAGRNPSFVLKSVEGCGHNVHFENSAEFVIIIGRFLNS
jgi:2-succinyl-6-hydroxy-2,4-cyclohexadiene-1-carboxylate synthase